MPTPYAKHEDQGRLLTLPPFFIISAFISLIFSQFFAKILNFPGNSCIRAHSSEHSDQADVMSMLALALLYTGYVRGKRGKYTGMGCMEEDSTQFALSRASTTYRALIIVGLVVLADVDPECILRVVLCNIRL